MICPQVKGQENGSFEINVDAPAKQDRPSHAWLDIWRNVVCKQRFQKCSQLLSSQICSGNRGAFYLWAHQEAESIMNKHPFTCLVQS